MLPPPPQVQKGPARSPEGWARRIASRENKQGRAGVRKVSKRVMAWLRQLRHGGSISRR
jgi:hypothetical protein